MPDVGRGRCRVRLEIFRRLLEAVAFRVPLLVPAVHHHDAAKPHVVGRDRGVEALGSGGAATVEDQRTVAVSGQPFRVQQSLRPADVHIA
jgi:hypothetical protein